MCGDKSIYISELISLTPVQGVLVLLLYEVKDSFALCFQRRSAAEGLPGHLYDTRSRALDPRRAHRWSRPGPPTEHLGLSSETHDGGEEDDYHNDALHRGG